MTFTAELARRSGHLVVYATIGALGRKDGATVAGRRAAYRWIDMRPTDHGYSLADADPFIEGLAAVALTEDVVDVLTGRTQPGSFSFSIADEGNTVATGHGWGDDILADLFGFRSTPNSWNLAADLSDTGTTLTLDNTTGLQVGDILHIGAEAVCITALPGSPNVTITRAVLDTDARAHTTRANGGDGVAYDRPQFLLGRRVRLFVNLRDAASGDLLAHSEAVEVWQGTLTDYSETEPRRIDITADPIIGKIWGAIGRRQFKGRCVITDDERLRMGAGEEVRLVVDAPQGAGKPPYPLRTFTGANETRKITYHALIRNSVALVHYYQRSAGPVSASHRIQAMGLMGTRADIGFGNARGRDGHDIRHRFWEVLTTSPDPLPDPAQTRHLDFDDGSGNPYTHPVDIMLALMTSTVGGTNGDHDVLPSTWGRGIPIAEIDTTSFLRVRSRYPTLRLPQLVIGKEGEPVDLYEWLVANILGPFGWFIYGAQSGALIGLGDVNAMYDTASLPAIDETDDIVYEVTVGGQTQQLGAQVIGQLAQTRSWFTFRWDPDFEDDDKPRHSHTFRIPGVEERYETEPQETVYDVPGLAPGYESGFAALAGRAQTMASIWDRPAPLLRVPVDITQLELDVTAGVLLSLSDYLNPLSSTRGYSATPCWVIGRAVDLDLGVIWLTLLPVPTRNQGLIPPAAKVSSYAAGLPAVVTVDANAVTDGDAVDSIPATDAAGLDDTTYHVSLYDKTFVPRNTNAADITVASVAGNNITLSGRFQDGGGDVTPVAGDWVAFSRYTSGTAPSATWTDNMKDHVASADDADSLLPNGDAAYVGGG